MLLTQFYMGQKHSCNTVILAICCFFFTSRASKYESLFHKQSKAVDTPHLSHTYIHIYHVKGMYIYIYIRTHVDK